MRIAGWFAPAWRIGCRAAARMPGRSLRLAEDAQRAREQGARLRRGTPGGGGRRGGGREGGGLELQAGGGGGGRGGVAESSAVPWIETWRPPSMVAGAADDHDERRRRRRERGAHRRGIEVDAGLVGGALRDRSFRLPCVRQDCPSVARSSRATVWLTVRRRRAPCGCRTAGRGGTGSSGRWRPRRPDADAVPSARREVAETRTRRGWCREGRATGLPVGQREGSRGQSWSPRARGGGGRGGWGGGGEAPSRAERGAVFEQEIGEPAAATIKSAGTGHSWARKSAARGGGGRGGGGGGGGGGWGGGGGGGSIGGGAGVACRARANGAPARRH